MLLLIFAFACFATLAGLALGGGYLYQRGIPSWAAKTLVGCAVVWFAAWGLVLVFSIKVLTSV